MLGKVSEQPSVGQWKVLPGHRNSERDSAPAPRLGLQHLPRCPHAHLPPPALLCPLPATKRARGCPGLTLEGLRGSVVDLQVVHQLLHAGEGQFAAVARALVVFPCKDTDPSASSLPRLWLSPPGAGLGSPGTGLRFSGRSSGAGVPPLPAAAIGAPGRAGSLQPAGRGREARPCRTPLCPPHPFKTGKWGLGVWLEGAGEAGALQDARAAKGLALGKAEVGR